MSPDKHYDFIYLSPHLDDAALSCGGQIYQRVQAGAAVLVLTVMAGDPPGTRVSDYAASFHERWAVGVDAVSRRREEDRAACAILGAEAVHWTVPDCIYREGPLPGASPVGERRGCYYRSDREIFGEVHPAEEALLQELSAAFFKLPPAQIIVPLAAGHHVDHRIVRIAAEQAWPPQRLAYYEDYPYVRDRQALAHALAQDQWRDEVVPLTPAALAAKCRAILAYRSQLGGFVDGEEDITQQVGAYAHQRGGEVLWTRQAAEMTG